MHRGLSCPSDKHSRGLSRGSLGHSPFRCLLCGTDSGVWLESPTARREGNYGSESASSCLVLPRVQREEDCFWRVRSRHTWGADGTTTTGSPGHSEQMSAVPVSKLHERQKVRSRGAGQRQEPPGSPAGHAGFQPPAAQVRLCSPRGPHSPVGGRRCPEPSGVWPGACLLGLWWGPWGVCPGLGAAHAGVWWGAGWFWLWFLGMPY